MSESVKNAAGPIRFDHFRPTPGWFTDAEMKHSGRKTCRRACKCRRCWWGSFSWECY